MNYTPKQLQVLRMVYDYQMAHGYAPTYGELAKTLGVSTITIFEHLQALERKGAIKRRRHEPRSVEIIEEDFLREQSTRRTLPVRGQFSAGKPILAAAARDEVQVGELFPWTPNTFLLRVRGDALADQHVLDGDLLVLEAGENAASGDVVVAVLSDGAAVLRTYVAEAGRARLVAHHPRHAAIAAEGATIQGVLKGLIRRARARAAVAHGTA